MAIDMGSASTIVAVRGRGVVIDEPSVVAVDRMSGNVWPLASKHKMQGREARDVAVIAPLIDGVVADFETTASDARPFCAGSAVASLISAGARS